MSLKNACMLVGLLLLAASPALARKWTDSTGQYSVEAELAGVKGDDVLLKKPDGSIVPVPISRLSDADRRYLEHLNKQTGETQGRLKTEQERPPGVAEPRPFAKEPKDTTVPTGGRDAAIAEIEKLRGYYQCNEQRPDRPIEEVRFSGRHVTDSVLEHLKGLSGLQGAGRSPPLRRGGPSGTRPTPGAKENARWRCVRRHPATATGGPARRPPTTSWLQATRD